jgi:signal transduction histidine kinase/CheY-like chemotaxis protein/integral membrane sensor domain MASE1
MTLMQLPAETDSPLSSRALGYAAIVGVAYFAAAWFGTALPGKTGFSSYIWVASGIAVGALLRSHPRHWPLLIATVYAASTLNGLRSGIPPLTAMSNLVSPLVVLVTATALHRAFKNRFELDSMQRVAIFTVVTVMATSMVSMLGALYAHHVMGKVLMQEWRAWFIADCLGILLLTPLVLAWTRTDRETLVERVGSRKLEVALLYTGLTVTSLFVFRSEADPIGNIRPLTYLCIPFLVWAALRFGSRGTTLALTIFSLTAFWYTARGFGPYASIYSTVEESALQLQGYLGAIIVMILFGSTLMHERARAQRENEAWRKRYEAAIAASGNLVFEIDPGSGEILWAGDTTPILGVPPEKVSTVRAWTARVHEHDRPDLMGLRGKLAKGELNAVLLEYRVRRGDDVYITIGVNAYSVESEDPLTDGPTRRIIGFIKDITEQKRVQSEKQQLEEKLKQAQKMEAIGRLAGGIAHDFNNILGAILGYGEMAQGKVAKDGDVKRYLDTIMAAGERGKALVAQILTFSRARPAEKQPVLVAALLDEVAALVQGSLPASIDFRVDVADRSLVVLGEVTQLHQLVMNVCTNAIQAMPRGGLLSLRAFSQDFAIPQVLRLGSLKPGRHVVIEVRDQGEGMDEDTLARIFEPFFTTKPTGKGTGLGLALTQSIAVGHGGGVDVQSEVGVGSVFTVYLPEATGDVAPKPSEETAVPFGNGESIMVVDDEPALLELAQEILAELGYEPVGFNDSLAAAEAYESNPGRFDLILTDEVMPQQTGTELAARLRERYPRLPILLISGYGGPGFEIRAQAAGVNQVLKKPYHKRELAEALSQALSLARESV